MKDAIMQNLRAVIANALMGREGDEGLKAKASEVFDQIGTIIAERDKALAEAERARRTLIAARGRMIALNQGNADLRERITQLTADLDFYKEKAVRVTFHANSVRLIAERAQGELRETIRDMFAGIEADMQNAKRARANEIMAEAEPLVLTSPEPEDAPRLESLASRLAPMMQEKAA